MVHARRVRLPDPAQARAIREASGVTAAELANALGVSRTSIWAWEANAHRPRGERRDAYARAIEELRALTEAGDGAHEADGALTRGGRAW